MKKFIGMISFGVILYLANGATMNFDGECYVLQSAGCHISVCCDDYKEKGYDHPMIFSMRSDLIDKVELTKQIKYKYGCWIQIVPSE